MTKRAPAGVQRALLFGSIFILATAVIAMGAINTRGGAGQPVAGQADSRPGAAAG